MNVRLRRVVWPVLIAVVVSAALSLRVEAKTPKKLADIADTIAATPILSKFNALLAASDLGTFLSSRGPFTVFSPTDSAFSSMPPATYDALLQPQNKERLQHIILMHVVNGKRILVHDLATLPTLLSCEGNPLKLKKTKSGTQLVMNAKLVHGDIRCENGLIHEIDTVLMPLEKSLPPLIPATVAPPPAPAPAPAVPTDTNAIPVAPAAHE
jgi:uncharacterized surface protein with fasciclin (FAS1) repeats